MKTKTEKNRVHQAKWYREQKNWDGIVYKITCIPEDSIYVGSTKNSLKKRWWQHKAAANSGKVGPIYDWIRLWVSPEFENSMFSIELLEEVSSGDSLLKREAYWINHLQADCNRNMRNYLNYTNNM